MTTYPRAAVLAIAGGVAALGAACSFSIDTAETVTQSFDVEAFNQIDIGQAFDATILVGPATSVEVEINDELVDKLSVVVENQRLVISLNDGLISTSGPMKVNITTPDLEALSANGAAEVEIEGLDAESFDLRVDGAADITADGSIGELTLDANGASNIDLDQVAIRRAEIQVDGATSVDFDDLQEIEGTIDGASSVDVPDGTTVDVETSGASSIE